MFFFSFSLVEGSELGLGEDRALLLQLQQLPLLFKDFASLLKHHLKALLALGGILLEALDGELLNTVLDLLPATAQGGNLGALSEGGSGVGGKGRGAGGGGSVCARLAHIDEVGHGHVHGAQGQCLGGRVDVGRLVDHGCVLAAEDRRHPLGRCLAAGDEALGAKNARAGVNAPAQRVDGDDVGRLLVPGPVLLPVVCRHLLP